ncbi:MAG: ThuA domain-containing protein [Candidatus Hydrogenedentes bacterium]|nr:ThuA domain-containing protein [Candidatus Hydrogenedentota bacterium]
MGMGLVLAALSLSARAADPWVTYAGGSGPGQGKHVVLISGDEEYRSEEGLPQLGKILSAHHGFACTVLFAINPESGLIDPNYGKNIPGLEALDTADLMIILTRFRDLPDEQMTHIDAYLKAGKPVIGLRTSTHAFNPPADSAWAHYGNGYDGEKTAWKEGFGRLVLGEHWISHHGEHKQESTVGLLAPGAAGHPILRGIGEGAIWCSTDVYGVRLPLPGDSAPLVLGQVTKRDGAYDEKELDYGMRPTDRTAVEGKKNDPMMPVAWTKTYQVPGGAAGKAFTSTMGASADLQNDALRRLIINAAYWATGLEAQIPAEGAKADLVGAYTPTQYAFRDAAYWKERAMSVDEHRK